MTIGSTIYGGPAVNSRQVTPEEIEDALIGLAGRLSNGSGLCSRDRALLLVGTLHGLLCQEAGERTEKGGPG